MSELAKRIHEEGGKAGRSHGERARSNLTSPMTCGWKERTSLLHFAFQSVGQRRRKKLDTSPLEIHRHSDQVHATKSPCVKWLWSVTSPGKAPAPPR